MLNIIKSKLNNTYKKKSLNNSNCNYIFNKDLVPAVRNWKSSVYAYNKNAISLIPIKSRYCNEIN